MYEVIFVANDGECVTPKRKRVAPWHMTEAVVCDVEEHEIQRIQGDKDLDALAIHCRCRITRTVGFSTQSEACDLMAPALS